MKLGGEQQRPHAGRIVDGAAVGGEPREIEKIIENNKNLTIALFQKKHLLSSCLTALLV